MDASVRQESMELERKGNQRQFDGFQLSVIHKRGSYEFDFEFAFQMLRDAEFQTDITLESLEVTNNNLELRVTFPELTSWYSDKKCQVSRLSAPAYVSMSQNANPTLHQLQLLQQARGGRLERTTLGPRGNAGKWWSVTSRTVGKFKRKYRWFLIMV